jgi:uncharacterized protein YjbI with pentapeptide repeats
LKWTKGEKLNTDNVCRGMGKCSYTWEEWDFKKGELVEKQCPRETWEGSDEYCIFHDPSPEKDVDLFKENLEEQLQSETDRYCFVGYFFPKEWDFSGKEFRFYTYFDGATFRKNASFSKATFNKKVDFSKATFGGVADFRETTFQKADFSESTFRKKSDFFGANFQEADFFGANFQESQFSFAIFQKGVDFNGATFQGDVYFYEATFHNVNFNKATFHKSVDFNKATFQENVDFNKATFQENAYFYEATFHMKADFWGVTFRSVADFRETTFEGDADFLGATFQKVEFFGSAFHKNAYFRVVIFQGNADFIATTVKEFLEFNPKQVLGILDFRGAKFFFSGSISANLKSAKFHRAHLQNVAFIDCTWPDNYVIYEEIHMEDEDINLPFSELETIYRDLKQNMQNHGDYTTAGEFYYREMEMRRKGSKTKRKRMWFEIYRFLAGYGEKPERTILSSLFTIILFALLYWVLGCLDYCKENIGNLEEIIYTLYFSFVTFTTLGLGDIKPLTHLGRALICCEAVIGAFLIALFVVVFARKMMR